MTTDVGTGTLPDSFTIKKLAQVKHVFNWTDAQFNQIMRTIAPDPAYTYTLGFHENSQLTLTTTRPYTLWVELRGGKFCITNVDQAFWNDLWASGGQYMSYDAAAKVITLNNLPDALLQTMFDVPLTVMPGFISCNGVAGFVILDYYIEEEIV